MPNIMCLKSQRFTGTTEKSAEVKFAPVTHGAPFGGVVAGQEVMRTRKLEAKGKITRSVIETDDGKCNKFLYDQNAI